jgi:hypothetical protein
MILDCSGSKLWNGPRFGGGFSFALSRDKLGMRQDRRREHGNHDSTSIQGQQAGI